MLAQAVPVVFWSAVSQEGLRAPTEAAAALLLGGDSFQKIVKRRQRKFVKQCNCLRRCPQLRQEILRSPKCRTAQKSPNICNEQNKEAPKRAVNKSCKATKIVCYCKWSGTNGMCKGRHRPFQMKRMNQMQQMKREDLTLKRFSPTQGVWRMLACRSGVLPRSQSGCAKSS